MKFCLLLKILKIKNYFYNSKLSSEVINSLYLFNNYSINTDTNIDVILDKSISLKNIDPNITLLDLYKKTKKNLFTMY